jgi:hypothetical protein
MGELGNLGAAWNPNNEDFCLVDIYEEIDGILGNPADLDDYGFQSAGEPDLGHLHSENVYAIDAIKEYWRLNAMQRPFSQGILVARRRRLSKEILDSVVGIINYFVLRGYRPVVTLDDADDSLEIGANLDADQLVLLHVRGSGFVDGRIYSKSFTTKTINRTQASDFLNWLDVQDR